MRNLQNEVYDRILLDMCPIIIGRLVGESDNFCSEVDERTYKTIRPGLGQIRAYILNQIGK